MRWAIVVIIVYQPKSRVMVWRSTRRLSPCDRLSSPASVMPSQLIIKANKTSHSYHYSLPVEAESDGVKSYKMSKPFWQTFDSPIVNTLTPNNKNKRYRLFTYLSKHSSRLFTTFIPFRLSLISLMSFLVKFSLKFTFISSSFFPLTCSLQQIGQFSHSVSQFWYFLAIQRLKISSSFFSYIRSASFFHLL